MFLVLEAAEAINYGVVRRVEGGEVNDEGIDAVVDRVAGVELRVVEGAGKGVGFAGGGAAGGDGLNLHSIINLAIYAAPKTKKRQIKA